MYGRYKYFTYNLKAWDVILNEKSWGKKHNELHKSPNPCS